MKQFMKLLLERAYQVLFSYSNNVEHLKKAVNGGGQNTDNKKSKLVSIYENDGEKEIYIEN